MNKMFKDCKSFNQFINLYNDSVKNMYKMFDRCDSLKTLPYFYLEYCKKNLNYDEATDIIYFDEY